MDKGRHNRLIRQMEEVLMESIDDLAADISREAKELLSCLITWEMYEKMYDEEYVDEGYQE